MTSAGEREEERRAEVQATKGGDRDVCEYEACRIENFETLLTFDSVRI